MSKYVTITEIAERLGISHSTVSRGLKDNPRISASTRAKIHALADELGYQKNATAKLLSTGESKLIAILVPDLSIYFFTKVIEGIQDFLEKEGYSILLFNTMESIKKEEDAIQACLNHRVDGVLAAMTMQTKSVTHFKKLIKYEVPLVFYDRIAPFVPVPKVVANDYQAAYNATQYLIDTGCKCIAHITASINLNNSNNRLYGYLDALRDNKLAVRESLIHYYKFKQQSIDVFIKKTLKHYPDLDGMFVFNDYVANYAVNLLHKFGKKIPEDVSVFGFSDEPVAIYMTPQLSSVQQIAVKMGNVAAQKIISVILKDEPFENEKIVIDQELVLRGTTKRKNE